MVAERGWVALARPRDDVAYQRGVHPLGREKIFRNLEKFLPRRKSSLIHVSSVA